MFVRRPAAIINLDPANDRLPYECAVDIAELITIDAVMEEFQLGPNGGLIYCMEFLVKNREWLLNRLAQLKGKYLIFDLPGQVELYTHHQGMHELVQSIQEWGYRVRPALFLCACDGGDITSLLSLPPPPDSFPTDRYAP